MDFDLLKAFLQKTLPISNYIYALRIDSYFCYVKARSIFHQMNLNPVQAEVTKIQPTFKISEIKGTLAGFRLPDYSKVINVPGYLRKFYLKITSLVGTYCIAKLNLDSYQ